MANALNRADSVSGSNPQFLAPGYLVHKVQEGTSRFDSDICSNRPNGGLVMVSNEVGNDKSTRSPTLVLCNDGFPEPLGNQQRPNFVVSPSLSASDVGTCPNGYVVANVFEAAMFLRQNGLHLKDEVLKSGLAVAIRPIGILCDDSCGVVELSGGPYHVLFANADKQSGRVFWDELGASGPNTSTTEGIWDTLCISTSSSVRFAYPRDECSVGIDERGVTAHNGFDSDNEEKDSYCSNAFGSSYQAANMLTVTKSLIGAFSAHFIETYMAERKDCCSETQWSSPVVFFTAAFDNIIKSETLSPASAMLMPTAGSIDDEDRRYDFSSSAFATVSSMVLDCRDCDFGSTFDDAGILVINPDGLDMDQCTYDSTCDVLLPGKRGSTPEPTPEPTPEENPTYCPNAIVEKKRSISTRGTDPKICDQNDNLYVACALKTVLESTSD